MKVLDKAKREVAYYRALFAHPRTPRASRWLLGAAVAYLVSPIDVIPDFIPVLGQLDDLLIVPCLIYASLAFIPAGVKAECRARVSGEASVPAPGFGDPERRRPERKGMPGDD